MNLWVIGLLLIPLFSDPASISERDGVVIKVASSANSSFHSSLYIKNKFAKKLMNSKSKHSDQQPELPRAIIEVGQKEYIFDSYSRLYDLKKGNEILISSAIRKELEKSVETVEKKHFGQLTPWNEMKKVFSRMSYAEIIDLETGEAFSVQRRAGSRHADVQPLTKEDTATMKKVYQGKWSWKRRAILISIAGKHYAASMHGMPHGAGAIRGNNFPGHFCVHFDGSSTHLRLEPDPSHNLMIRKASGGLNQYLIHAKPMEVVDTFLISLNEQDLSTMALTMTTSTASLPISMDKISGIKNKIKQAEEGNPEVLAAEIPVEISYSEEGAGLRTGTWVFHVKRASTEERWKITDIQVMLIE